MKVILYSTPKIPECQKVKDFLNAHNIRFEEVNVEGDEEKVKELIRKSGQVGVPVLDIDGSILIGYDEGQLIAVFLEGQNKYLPQAGGDFESE